MMLDMHMLVADQAPNHANLGHDTGAAHAQHQTQRQRVCRQGTTCCGVAQGNTRSGRASPVTLPPAGRIVAHAVSRRLAFCRARGEHLATLQVQCVNLRPAYNSTICSLTSMIVLTGGG